MSFKTMPNRIRKFRKSRGMTMKELAELCSTSQQQIDRLEKGQRKLTLEWLEKLSKAMQCSMAEFLPNSYQNQNISKTSRAKVIGSINKKGIVSWFAQDGIYNISFGRPKKAFSQRLFALIVEEEISGYNAGTELIFSDLSGEKGWEAVPGNRLAIFKDSIAENNSYKHKVTEIVQEKDNADPQAVLVKVLEDLG